MNDMQLAAAEFDIRLKPEFPEAGADMEVKVTTDRSAVAGDCLFVVLRDGAGQELGRATPRDGTDGGAPFVALRLAAPMSAGHHCWSISLEAEQDPFPTRTLSFDVRPAAIRPSVWNLPPAVVAGQPFRFSVGLANTSGTAVGSIGFVLEDQDGTTLHRGTTGANPLPGLPGIHGAEVALVAPSETGRHVWRLRPVVSETDGLEVPLAVDLHLNIVQPPECTIRLHVVDAATGASVERARVVAHPFRAMTDADGRAEIPVPPGIYRVFVTGHQYFPFRVEADLETTVNVDILAEMHVDRPLDETDQWA